MLVFQAAESISSGDDGTRLPERLPELDFLELLCRGGGIWNWSAAVRSMLAIVRILEAMATLLS